MPIRGEGKSYLKELGNRIFLFSFLFLSITAFCSSIDFANPSEITTRKIVKKKKKTRVSPVKFAIVSRFARERSIVFHDRYPRVFYTCSEGINEVFPALTKFRSDSPAK